MSDYKLWINDDRTVLVRWWEDGTVEVCRREHPDAIWGPPVELEEERSLRLDPPMLTEGPLSGRVYVVTHGKVEPHPTLKDQTMVTASVKYDVTDQFEALAARRVLGDERRAMRDQGDDWTGWWQCADGDVFPTREAAVDHLRLVSVDDRPGRLRQLPDGDWAPLRGEQ